MARALLHRPDWLFLDEATSALDEASERRLYGLLEERMPHATVVSIAHRPTVGAFHRRQFRLVPDRDRMRLATA
jgi:putative ATP-binding cassette transporter